MKRTANALCALNKAENRFAFTDTSLLGLDSISYLKRQPVSKYHTCSVAEGWSGGSADSHSEFAFLQDCAAHRAPGSLGFRAEAPSRTDR